MSSDGFSTLTASLMERGSDRVRAVIGGSAMAKMKDDTSPKARPPVPAPLQAPAEPPAPITCSQDESRPEPEAEAARNRARPEQIRDSRRASSGSTVLIQQPPSGDMSQVTVSLWGATPEMVETNGPSRGGQRPTSVTYERCTLDERTGHLAAEAAGAPQRQLWIDTPNYSGPDRRTVSISPEVERRKSVPPRLKVSVRLEQERYLRLKLATRECERTQQDLITSALDSYLDALGVDRFVRIAMGFAGAEPTLGQDNDPPRSDSSF